jgi:hypothetical protein
MTRRTMLAGTYAPCRDTHARQVKGWGPDEVQSLVLQIFCWANNPDPEKSTVTKPPEPMEEDHGKGPGPPEGCSASSSVYYATLLASFTTFTVLAYVCMYESSLDGLQWTGSTKDKHTSVTWVTSDAHFTQRYPCTRSWVQGRTGLCKKIA